MVQSEKEIAQVLHTADITYFYHSKCHTEPIMQMKPSSTGSVSVSTYTEPIMQMKPSLYWLSICIYLHRANYAVEAFTLLVQYQYLLTQSQLCS